MPDQNITYPYDDDKMIFDPSVQQYVLTEQALLSRGVDIRAQLSATSGVSPEGVIENIVRLASDMIYGFIHEYSADNMAQDRLIACVPSLRPIIYNAMLYQAVYVYYNGNLSLSTNRDERNMAYDDTAKKWLGRTVPELGTSILYVGV